LEMHDPTGLLEIAAFVAILRNSTGGADHVPAQSWRARRLMAQRSVLRMYTP
jgi:hypothetical protein